ncbi:VCBS domain-containing protein [Pseudoalteromonas sp. MMG007]|uniref:VCBS domain-containing protein n=1 Tax=Pseudoalteromonas sp. MMG007 TaxID=2822684 RepID=UPI0032B46700
MSKFGLRVITIFSVCFIGFLVVGCGSSGSNSQPVNALVAAQSAVVISAQTVVNIESNREIAITGELFITDAQTDKVTVTSADDTTAKVSITIIGVARSDDFLVNKETKLNADGINTGLSAYTLIENAFSEGSIESPDMYSGNHQDVEHIIDEWVAVFVQATFSEEGSLI